MARSAHVHINTQALLHNLAEVKRVAPNKQIIAMVKANAYGCGLSIVAPVLEEGVDAFGVACLEEAMAIRALGVKRDCILVQGVFNVEELQVAAEYKFQCVVHRPEQLQWLLSSPLEQKIKVWVKVNTGLNRLGFQPADVYVVINALHSCPWVDDNIGLMTHLACADEPANVANKQQLERFATLRLPNIPLTKSIANSAAIMALPETHADVVRPGIMLYGVSPFSNQTGAQSGLIPVMRFVSAICAIHHYPVGAAIGYGGTWTTKRPSIIGVVAAGYGDGYPRNIASNTPVWVNGKIVPIVGRVSMDVLMVDLTDCPDVAVNDAVELWGQHIPVETIANKAGTIGYELLCQLTSRVR